MRVHVQLMTDGKGNEENDWSHEKYAAKNDAKDAVDDRGCYRPVDLDAVRALLLIQTDISVVTVIADGRWRWRDIVAEPCC